MVVYAPRDYQNKFVCKHQASAAEAQAFEMLNTEKGFENNRLIAEKCVDLPRLKRVVRNKVMHKWQKRPRKAAPNGVLV